MPPRSYAASVALIEAVLSGDSLTEVFRKNKAHPVSYPWHDHDFEQLGEAEYNPGAYQGKAPGYSDVAGHYGEIKPGESADLRIIPYRAHHVAAVDKLLKDHGYEHYLAGGEHPRPDLRKKNYTTGHLMIWDPSEGSGGDFGHEQYTHSWRRVHELAHALTYPEINKIYGEGQRVGRLGAHRSTREAKRAVHWEWLAAHKQRELGKSLGIHVSDKDHAKEVNTVMHDAVYRIFSGKFTSPNEEGFHPSENLVPLETSLDLVQKRSDHLGLAHADATFRVR